MPRNLDGDEVAVDRSRGRAGRDRRPAPELLLVARNQAASPAGKTAKDPERAMPGAVDEFDDASAGLLLARLLDADQRPVADAGDFTRPGAARRADVDDRGRATRVLVPFGRPRQKLAVAVAAGNVGEHHVRQGAGMMQPFAAPI